MLPGPPGVFYRRTTTVYPGRDPGEASWLSERNRARERNSGVGGRRHRRSRSVTDFLASDDLHCEIRSTIKVGILQVDSRDFSGLKDLRMAGRVWSLFGRRLAKGNDS